MGLKFYPLYWVYHDFWDYTQSSYTINSRGETLTKTSTYNHFGHMHFFMPGFYTQQMNIQQAYFGNQTFNFSLEQLWGPTSKDVNQQFNFKVIGKPKWYFYIQQYWRRVYIQNWQYKDNKTGSGFLGKKGIKYDASLPCHTRGIFRQTKDNYFFYSDLCRTLPIQYWRDNKKTVRDHYLRLNNASQEYDYFYRWYGRDSWKKSYNDIVKSTWDFQNDYPQLIDKTILPKYDYANGYVDYTDFYTHYDQFTIPRKAVCDGDPNYPAQLISKQDKMIEATQKYRTFCDQYGARISTYPDRYYIHPIIQYQKVIQKNWQRLDGWQQRDVQSQQSGFSFGDGYNITVTIPYQATVDGKSMTMSPFSDDNGKVYGAGIYQHNVVKQQDKLKINVQYNEDNQLLFNNYQFELLYNKPRSTWCRPTIQQLYDYDLQKKDLNCTFSYPVAYKPYLDGMWVEQCLGAIVKAKVKVITEDNYGARRQNWVQTTTSNSTEPFVGKQQPDE